MQLRQLALSLAAVGLLSACGGGGSDAPAPAAPTPPPPSGGTTTVTLTGVAATGAALAGASVSASCATGSGTATAGSNGSYTISISGGALPCVLQASSGSTALRSVATGSGNVTANITPLTELLVAQLAGQDPAAFATAVDASKLALVTPANVAAAQTAVVATLTAAGVDTAAVGNFVSGTLVAAVGGTGGNAYDQVLDALATTLTSAGTTLATLTTTVATTSSATSSGSASTTPTDAPSLPADLLLKSKAANCAAFASGSYRVIKAAPSLTTGATDPVTAIERFNVDAATLTLSDAANPADTWTWTANGACRYSSADGSDIVVSPAGVVVARAAIGLDDTTVGTAARGSTRLVVGLPVQSFTLADLAGTWNYLNWQTGSSGFIAEAATIVIGSDGKVGSVKCDQDGLGTAAASCTETTTLLPAFSTHADGGFTLTSTNPADAWSDRAWMYRSGSGELMLVTLSPNGELTFATKQRTLGLPTVGDNATLWNLFNNVGNLASDLVSTTTNTTTAVDSTAGSYSRNSASNGSTVTVPQTVVQNSGRAGYAHRLGATGVTASDGSTTNVREGWFLPLKGFGLTAIYLPNSSTGASSNARFGLSVKQP